MPLNPLAPVTDYQSMLNRIFWFTTISAWVSVWMLRQHVPAIEAWLQDFDAAIGVNGQKLLPTPASYLVPALTIGIAARIFRLHGRISDWLGLRECFDVEVIIGEFGRQLSVDLQGAPLAEIRRARHYIMRTCFYPYVSGASPQIDQQLVLQALDAWSWFWAGVEATLLFAVTGLILIACHAYDVGLQTFGAAVAAATFVLPAIRRQCQRYAIAQVRAILADPARAAVALHAFCGPTESTALQRTA